MLLQRKFILFFLALLLGVGALAGLTWANYRFAQQSPGGNDFLARWMGARYWVKEGISPYSPDVSTATQKAIYGRTANPAKGEDIGHFAYPLNSMIFFAPFGLLDYLPARALWMTLLEISLAALVLVSIRLVGWAVSPWKIATLILFSLIWYHGARTIIIGQFAGINAFLIVCSLLLIALKRDVLAGALLALSTAKPQMVFLIIPFVLFWAISAKRWYLLWSLLISSLLLLGISLILLPSWPMQMMRQMLEYPTYTNIGSPLSIIAGSIPGTRAFLNIFLHVIAFVYLFVEWYFLYRKKDEGWFLWTALMTLVITNLVAFRTATTNYVMLLPALFLIFKVFEDRWKIRGHILVWFLLTLLFAGLWTLFIVTVQGNVEQAIMYLPLPFFCLVGLLWVRWQMMNTARVDHGSLVNRDRDG